MSKQLAPNLKVKFFDSSRIPLIGGKLYSYQVNSLIPLATYTSESGEQANTNPIVLNSTGAANVWLTSDGYKFILKDADDNVLWTVDNVYIVNPDAVDKTKTANDIVNLGLERNISGSIDVLVDDTTVQITSNQLKVKNLTASNLDGSLLEVVYQNVEDISVAGLYQTLPQFEWSSPLPISNAAPLPGGGGRAVRWSPNGQVLALALGNSSPYLSFYNINKGVLVPDTSMSIFTLDSGGVLAGEVKDLSWSSAGNLLAVAHVGSPYISIYKRDRTRHFTAAGSNPSTLPLTDGTFCSFSPNGNFLAVSSSGGGFNLYALVSTPTNHGAGILNISLAFTDITATSTLTNISGACRWTQDSSLFAAVDTVTGNIDVFTRANNVFTAITGPSMSSYSNDVVDFAFSPDRRFLAVAVNISPFILIFQMTGNTFSQLPNPATLPTGIPNCLRWSANSQHLIVGHAVTPYLTIYSISGTTFTKLANPSVLPVGAVLSADWSPTKQFLSLMSAATPYLQTYETGPTLPSNSIQWTREAPNV